MVRPRMNRLHRFAAIVAAYAIALQALFGAFAVPGHLTFADAAICQSDTDSGAPAQSNHDGCCPGCVAGHCAHLLLGTSRVAMIVAWPAPAASGANAPDIAIPVRVADHGPHAARAPPAG